MLTSKYKTYLLSTIIFVYTILYSILCHSQNDIVANSSTVIFIFFNFLTIFLLSKSPVSPWGIISINTALYLGIGVGHYLSSAPETSIWMIDSIRTHIPRSLHFMDFYTGEKKHLFTGLIIYPGSVTHAFFGFIFMVFGKNVYSTLFGIFLIKSATILVTYKTLFKLFDNNKAIIGTLVYTFLPTIMFYTVAFYKEATVQLLFSLIIYLTIIIKDKKSYWIIPLLTIILALLSRERFYIAAICIPYLFLEFLTMKNISKLTKGCIVTAILISVIYLIKLQEPTISDDPTVFFERLKELRESYKSLPHVNQINYSLPYPLAFIKLLYSPYMTLNKFAHYHSYSLLLIWGSFFNQFVIVIASIGFFKAIRERKWNLIRISTPLLILLTFAAYISPYSARLRDSTYLVILIFAIYLMRNVLGKKNTKKC